MYIYKTNQIRLPDIISVHLKKTLLYMSLMQANTSLYVYCMNIDHCIQYLNSTPGAVCAHFNTNVYFRTPILCIDILFTTPNLYLIIHSQHQLFNEEIRLWLQLCFNQLFWNHIVKQSMFNVSSFLPNQILIRICSSTLRTTFFNEA